MDTNDSMTDPTPLSPAAQAVLKAAMSSRGGRFRVPATLRAAACQLTSAKAIDTLRAIAAELEGANNA